MLCIDYKIKETLSPAQFTPSLSPPICWLLVVVEVVEIRSLKVNKHLVSKKKVVKKQKPKLPILAATSLLAVRPNSSRSSLKADNVDHKCINIQ